MKKLLLTAATAVTFLSSPVYAAENDFYAKVNVGWDKLTKVSGLKSNNDVFFGVGVGYYAMDNLRTDLTFDHYANPSFKGTFDTLSTKLKANANTLLLNAYVDLFDVSIANVFLGAGVGWAIVDGKVSYGEGAKYPGVAAGSYKLKRKNNFAFAGHIGASAEFAPGVKGELTYSYRDLGKLKASADGWFKSVQLRGHHIAAGVRFDI